MSSSVSMKCLKQAKPQRQEVISGCQGLGGGGNGYLTANEYEVSFKSDKNVLELNIDDGRTTF